MNRIQKFKNKLIHAFVGLGYTWYSQSSFRIQFAFCIIMWSTAITFSGDVNGQLNMSISFILGALILSYELFNTAIEKMCDFISPKIHPVIKIIKDCSSGAVLATCIIAMIWYIIIFGPKILNLILRVLIYFDKGEINAIKVV